MRLDSQFIFYLEARKTHGNQYVKFDEVVNVVDKPLAFRTDGFFEWLNQQHLDQK